MDEFPGDFNRARCTETMKDRQAELIKEVREKFYIQLKDGINNCDRTVTLEFPKNLWYDSRLVITGEILKRFGEVKVMDLQNNYKVERMTNDFEQIPKNIVSVIIEF